MFLCMVTNKLSKPGEKLNKITIETRIKEYKHYDREAEEEWFTHGTEIVREVNATASGVRVWEAWNEEERAAFVKGLN